MTAIVGLAVLCLVSATAKSYAADGGWQQDAQGWWYQYIGGEYAVSTWMLEQNTWYHFDEQGYMDTGWYPEGSEWYYMAPDGAMQTGWLGENGNWYYMDSNGLMQKGWVQEGSRWYFMDESGVMQTGWIESGGNWYYMHQNGAMAVETWVQDSYVDAAGVWIPAFQPAPAEEPTVDSAQTDGTLAGIMAKIQEMKVKYPDGMYWNHMGYPVQGADINAYSETITSVPCNHAVNGMDYCNTYSNYGIAYIIAMQCDGFARKLSDEIFGESAPAMDYAYSFDAVKIGDYLRYSNSHTVFVIGKTDTGIQVAECNIGGTCVIRWGRTITRSDLDSGLAITCFTRY